MRRWITFFVLSGMLIYPTQKLCSQRLGSMYQDGLMNNSRSNGFGGSVSSPVVFRYSPVSTNSSVIYVTSPRLSNFTLFVNDTVRYDVVKHSYQDFVIIENVPAGIHRLHVEREKKWPFREDLNAETTIVAKGEGERIRWAIPKPRYGIGATALQVGGGLAVLVVLSTYGRQQ